MISYNPIIERFGQSKSLSLDFACLTACAGTLDASENPHKIALY